MLTNLRLIYIVASYTYSAVIITSGLIELGKDLKESHDFRKARKADKKKIDAEFEALVNQY